MSRNRGSVVRPLRPAADVREANQSCILAGTFIEARAVTVTSPGLRILETCVEFVGVLAKHHVIAEHKGLRMRCVLDKPRLPDIPMRLA